MTRLLDEVQAMQNPALGATLLWRFSCGYSPASSAKGTPLPLVFIVLPLAFHARSLEEVAATQTLSGLRKFHEKFSDRGDLVLAIQPRMLALRDLSLRSLSIGLHTGLYSLAISEAMLWPRSYAHAPDEGASGSLLKSVEKLGVWCAGLTIFEVAGILNVEF
jgi:hypothetical protein